MLSLVELVVTILGGIASILAIWDFVSRSGFFKKAPSLISTGF